MMRAEQNNLQGWLGINAVYARKGTSGHHVGDIELSSAYAHIARINCLSTCLP